MKIYKTYRDGHTEHSGKRVFKGILQLIRMHLERSGGKPGGPGRLCGSVLRKTSVASANITAGQCLLALSSLSARKLFFSKCTWAST